MTVLTPRFASKGLSPSALSRFIFLQSFIDRLVEGGEDKNSLLGPQALPFLDQLYGWQTQAKTRKDREAYANAIFDLRKNSSKGIGFERFVGGREIEAVANALREEPI